jgi:hypothetical protein
MRLFVGRRTIVGKNSHPFKGHQKVDHYHFGERVKYVRRPKELRGWWIKWRGKYERFGKVVKRTARERFSKLRGGRGKKRRGNRQRDQKA